MAFIDITGSTFGKWTVVRRTDYKKVVKYLCRCECGIERVVLSASLRSGKSVSCGCFRPETQYQLARREHRGAYVSWVGMKQRVGYPGHIEFHRYGGRGIAMDPRWKSFEVFLADMGPRPPGTSIDRIDTDGNYEPGNCKWSTRAEQMSNTSRCVLVEHEGEQMTLKQLSIKLGLSYDRLHRWHRDGGLPIDQAIARAASSPRRRGQGTTSNLQAPVPGIGSGQC